MIPTRVIVIPAQFQTVPLLHQQQQTNVQKKEIQLATFRFYNDAIACCKTAAFLAPPTAAPGSLVNHLISFSRFQESK